MYFCNIYKITYYRYHPRLKFNKVFKFYPVCLSMFKRERRNSERVFILVTFIHYVKNCAQMATCITQYTCSLLLRNQYLHIERRLYTITHHKELSPGQFLERYIKVVSIMLNTYTLVVDHYKSNVRKAFFHQPPTVGVCNCSMTCYRA